MPQKYTFYQQLRMGIYINKFKFLVIIIDSMKKLMFMIFLFFVFGCVNTFTNISKENCDYENDVKKYIGKSNEECSRIRFMCETSREYFADECGCGCKLKQSSNLNKKENFCTPEQKKAEVCIQVYKPVCGWSDPQKIQCIKYPCAQIFSNSCFACADENVLYWTEGECPE